jgi:ATP-binding cassette, subfamily C, bacterial CydD
VGQGRSWRFSSACSPPAAVWAVFSHALVGKITSFLALGAAFTARSLAQRTWAARVEAELVDQMAESVLYADALRASVLPEEDARIEVVQAIYQSAQALVQTLPNFAADVVACAALGAWIVSREPARLVGLAGGLTVAAGAALISSRRAVERALEGAWKVQRRVYDGFADALEGRLEIVASGQRSSFLERLGGRTTAWAAAGVRVAMATTLSGRLPMVAMVGLVALVVLIRGPGGLVASVADVALFASVTPAFAGVAQGLHGLARGQRWMGVLARIKRAARGPSGGTRAPSAEMPSRIVFERVSFQYDTSARAGLALHAVDFACEGRGTLGLSGVNGSGKSTCLRLLLGLAVPSEGTVRVGGAALGEIDLDAWRRSIAFPPTPDGMRDRGGERLDHLHSGSSFVGSTPR